MLVELLRIFVVFDFVFVKINGEIGGILMLFGFDLFLLKMLSKYFFFYLLLLNFFVVFVWIWPGIKIIFMFVYYLYQGSRRQKTKFPIFKNI
ncbi:unnamed protein product [Meloidogyne enterolobii]|uniref:Uncharacterized protein n=1 Tax=Meloidogyne enterolobii TaxID=390850 RepID=A0ACB0ZR13_MELEN